MEKELEYETFLEQEMGDLQGKPFYHPNGTYLGRPLNLIGFITRYGHEAFPDSVNGLGFYHLFYKDELVYIGMSKCIKKRLLEHLKSVDISFDSVIWYPTPNHTVEQVLEIERRLISFWNPKLNVSRGSGSSGYHKYFTEGEIQKVIASMTDCPVEQMTIFRRFLAVKE